MLELAGDERIPLLERVQVPRDLLVEPRRVLHDARGRAAGPVDAGHRGARPPTGSTPAGRLRRGARARRGELVERQARAVVRGARCRSSPSRGSASAPCDRRPRRARASSRERFRGTIFPVLTPLAVGPGRPFPYISNLSLSLGVMLRDPETGHERVRARQGAGRGAAALPARRRRAATAARAARGRDRRHLDTLFPGMEVDEHAAFRVTRDADFEIPRRPTTCSRPSSASCAGAASARSCASSSSRGMSAGSSASSSSTRSTSRTPTSTAVDGLLDLADLMRARGAPGHPDLRDDPEWQR